MFESVVQFDFGVSRENVRDTSYRWNNAKRRHGKSVQVAQLVWSGEGRYADHSGERLVGRNDIMLFNIPETSQYWYPKCAVEPWVFSWINLTGLDVFWNDLRRTHGSVIALGEGSEAARLLRECARRFEENDFRDAWESSAMAYQFVTSLAREVSEGSRTPDSRWERVRALLLDTRGGTHSVKEVAAGWGMSREHFTRAFRAHFGECPGELLRKARLRNAKTLLRQSGFALERVATASGFGSAAALCRAFRKETGLPPGEWRKEGGDQMRKRISRTIRAPKRA